MALSNSPIKAHNQRIRLHQDQAAFTTCLSYLELNEILDCLRVCHYWHSSLKKSRVGWSGSTFSFDRSLHLAPVYYPFITRLQLIHRIDDLTPTALESFTHVTSIHLTERTYAPWMEPARLENLFGLLPTIPSSESLSTAPTPIHCSPILSFHLNWCRGSSSRFPLQRVLEHPRFAALQEFSIRESDPPSRADMIAIGKLKEIRTLTCRVQVADVISLESSWVHEVIHELPLLHTLDLDMLPEGMTHPLPATLTDLTLGKLPQPAGLCTVFGSLNALRSFTFDASTFFTEPQSGWTDWMTWLEALTTLELVHLTVGVASRSSMQLLHSFVTNNSSHLYIRLIKCNGFGMNEMELVRPGTPPLDTHLLPYRSHEKLSNQFHEAGFREWDVRCLKELYFVDIPSSPILINLLSHLSQSSEQTPRLEHLEVSTPHLFVSKTSMDNCHRFCEFLAQQIHLRTLVLQGGWIHENWRDLRGALIHCQQLNHVKLTSPVFNCPGHALLARTLSELPHLTHLDLRGQCLSSLPNLTHFVTSKSLRDLSCVLIDASAHPAEALEINEFLAAHPHINTRVNGRPPQELVEHFRRTTATRAAATANMNKTPPTTPPRRCLIQ